MLVEGGPDAVPGGGGVSPRRNALRADHVDDAAPAAEPLGVVNLSDRRSGQPFTAGDQKLIAAIATQIGTAIQNARLVRASLEQQRLAHEMQLAHDLQMKLLPDDRDRRAGRERRGARRARGERRRRFLQSVPPRRSARRRDDRRRLRPRLSGRADHGADDERVGDSRADDRPIRARCCTRSCPRVRDELTTTEMFISAFYAVIDPIAGRAALRATPDIRTRSSSAAGRALSSGSPASDPPLGMAERAPATVRRRWDPRAAICSCCSPTA